MCPKRIQMVNRRNQPPKLNQPPQRDLQTNNCPSRHLPLCQRSWTPPTPLNDELHKRTTPILRTVNSSLLKHNQVQDKDSCLTNQDLTIDPDLANVQIRLKIKLFPVDRQTVFFSVPVGRQFF